MLFYVTIVCILLFSITITTLEKNLDAQQKEQWELRGSAQLIILLDENSGSELIKIPINAETLLLPPSHPLKKMYDAFITVSCT